MVLGQEVQLTLRPAEQPLPEEQPGANRNLRLDDMVARTERVDIRIHEDHNAHLLIVLQKMPEYGHRCKSESEDTEENPQANARDEHHAEEDRKKDQRRSEIRLLQNEQERDENIAGNRCKVADRPHLSTLFHHCGKRDDHDEF